MSVVSNLFRRSGRLRGLSGKSKRISELNFIRSYTRLALLMLAMVSISALDPPIALAASAGEIDRNATQALTTLYRTTPGAKELANNAKGVLVFPHIVKGGLIVAGQYGDGALRKGADRFAIPFDADHLAAAHGLTFAGVDHDCSCN